MSSGSLFRISKPTRFDMDAASLQRQDCSICIMPGKQDYVS